MIIKPPEKVLLAKVNAASDSIHPSLSEQLVSIDTGRAAIAVTEKARKEIGQVGYADKSSRLVSAVRRTMFNTENRDTRRYQNVVG